MNIVEIIFPFILLTLFIYAILLLTMGLLKMMNLIAYEYNSSNKLKNRIGFYINHFFVDPVNKNVSQTRLVLSSLVLASLITFSLKIAT